MVIFFDPFQATKSISHTEIDESLWSRIFLDYDSEIPDGIWEKQPTRSRYYSVFGTKERITILFDILESDFRQDGASLSMFRPMSERLGLKA